MNGFDLETPANTDLDTEIANIESYWQGYRRGRDDVLDAHEKQLGKPNKGIDKGLDELIRSINWSVTN